MAQGTVVVFDDFIEYLMKGSPECPFDFGATPDVVKCAIVNNTSPPVVTTPDPCWGAGGTTNLSTNEESGGSMTAGGLVCSNVAVSVVGNVPQLDMDDPATWAQNASNPTACYWAVLYSDTATNKNCIGFIDLGGVFDATTGDLTITLGAPFLTIDPT
jgi:hypothetical protein